MAKRMIVKKLWNDDAIVIETKNTSKKKLKSNEWDRWKIKNAHKWIQYNNDEMEKFGNKLNLPNKNWCNYWSIFEPLETDNTITR